MENMTGGANLSESAIVPQDFVTEPVIKTKLKEAIETNEEVSREFPEDFDSETENETELEDEIEPNEEVDQKIPEDFVVETVNEAKIGEVAENVVETANERKPEEVMETNDQVKQEIEEAEVEKDLEENVVGAVVQLPKLETKREDENVESRGVKRKAIEMKSKDGSKSEKSENESTPVLKKQKLEVSVTDPKFLKPFDFGWKRELVYRNATNEGKKINCDIYYYSPTGKKFRSIREVAENLTDDVTIENFTFMKKPLGVDDPEKEIVRNAKTKLSAPERSAPNPTKNASPKKKSTVATPEVIVTTTPLQKNKVKMSNRQRSKTKKTEEKIDKTSTLSTPKMPKLEASSKKRKRVLTFAGTKTKVSQAKKTKLIEVEDFFGDMAARYNIFLEVFKYLEVEYLLNAARVSKMWNFMANNQSLWQTVHLKNSHLQNWRGLVNTLKKNGTIHLDLRKTLLPSKASDDFWNEFTTRIKKVKTLRKIYMCPCPAEVVEQLCISNPKLEVVSATMINSKNMETRRLAILQNLQELHLKAISSFTLTSDLNALTELTQLKHLSLTSISNLNQLNLSVIGNLINLKSLSLGDCINLPLSFPKDVLSKLEGLEQLRLENGQGNYFTIEILEQVKNLKHFEQLELINFDLKTGFDRALGECTNIKKLFLIPNYNVQSSVTCHIVLGGVTRLKSTLTHFVWGITCELIKTTEFLAAQHDNPENEEEKKLNTGDCIPILKPIPNLENLMENLPAQDEVQIMTLSELQKILLKNIPNTRTKILKIPFHSTWKQSLQTW